MNKLHSSSIYKFGYFQSAWNKQMIGDPGQKQGLILQIRRNLSKYLEARRETDPQKTDNMQRVLSVDKKKNKVNGQKI